MTFFFAFALRKLTDSWEQKEMHSIQNKQRFDNSKFLIDKSRSTCASVSRRFGNFNIPMCGDKSFRGA